MGGPVIASRHCPVCRTRELQGGQTALPGLPPGAEPAAGGRSPADPASGDLGVARRRGEARGVCGRAAGPGAEATHSRVGGAIVMAQRRKQGPPKKTSPKSLPEELARDAVAHEKAAPGSGRPRGEEPHGAGRGDPRGDGAKGMISSAFSRARCERPPASPRGRSVCRGRARWPEGCSPGGFPGCGRS
jgi:hypothetical protein